MTDGYKKCKNQKEFKFYCDLLSISYNLYALQHNGMVCGAGAEEIRDNLFAHIQSEYLKGN